jgi:hypothetical protein
MNKVPFAVLSIEVDKLYARQFPSGADTEIEEHIAGIVEFIKVAGWEEEEFMDRWLQETGEIPLVYLPVNGASN